MEPGVFRFACHVHSRSATLIGEPSSHTASGFRSMVTRMAGAAPAALVSGAAVVSVEPAVVVAGAAVVAAGASVVVAAAAVVAAGAAVVVLSLLLLSSPQAAASTTPVAISAASLM